MQVTSRDRVTMPVDLRRLAGIRPDGEVGFGIESGKIAVPAKGAVALAEDGERLARFFDALNGTGDPTMDAESVMKLARDR